MAQIEQDDLSTKIVKAYRADKTFTPKEGDNAGQLVNYNRLVLEFSVGGKPYEIEAKVNKDQWAILALADEVREPVIE